MKEMNDQAIKHLYVDTPDGRQLKNRKIECLLQPFPLFPGFHRRHRHHHRRPFFSPPGGFYFGTPGFGISFGNNGGGAFYGKK